MNQRSLTQTHEPKPWHTTGAGPVLQRHCACGNHTLAGGECEGCRKNPPSLQQGEVPSIVHDVLRSPGQTLDAGARTLFGPRFGRDAVSRVRVHTDARAAESARAVNALAYTVDRNVVFGAAQYAPETPRGRRLLAHELAHVVQQGSATASWPLEMDEADGAAERDAAKVASQAVGGNPEAVPADSRTPVRLARQAAEPAAATAPAGPNRVELIRVSCETNTIEFETDVGVFRYELVACDIPDADYMATVTVEGNDVNFSPPPDALGAHVRFPYRVEPGQPNPSTFFGGQTIVHIVTGTVTPAPGGGAGPGPAAAPTTPVQVCSRDLQVSPKGKHAYIEAPPFRYAIISPTCPQHWYDNPLTGTGGQKWDSSPDPCGKTPTCISCLPAPGVTDVAKCMRSAFTAYNNPSLYRLLGPNSNTFAGTLARTCCAGMVPKPPALGWMPGWDHSPAPARAGTRPCPPGPTC